MSRKKSNSSEEEWNLDFNWLWYAPNLFDEDQNRAFRMKGRCRFCWGNLIGKKGEDQIPTAIRCCVCGILVEGEDAHQEYQTFFNSGIKNGLNELSFGQFPDYGGKGKFIAKVFPGIDQSIGEAEYQHTDGAKLLCRKSFPIGSPALLTLQAQALVSSIEIPNNLFQTLNIPFIDLQNDGTARVGDSDELDSGPTTILRDQAMQALGSVMRNSMVGAFSCELTMKGITLSLSGTAKKTHDLHDLYLDLPDESKRRIERDQPDVADVLEQSREIFGKWRYFEKNVSSNSLKQMIDYERCLSLARIARILLDEAEIVGLSYGVELSTTGSVKKENEHTKLEKCISIKLRIRGQERTPIEKDKEAFKGEIKVRNYCGTADISRKLWWEY
ncbi:MAG: hypothetical protein OXI60_04270 [Acidiferrobacterales bacterium]|nr:hypothetical protein [Acidiferrobacterales bacterium]